MSDFNNSKNTKALHRKPVRTLSPEVARKIAAGEVIDRPNAIVRELMDNAVDSGADTITVEISQGGIEKIRITDNGCGMSKEDLLASARPHATSKITEASDLMNLSTLGFRGEALASIAAVSRLTVSSGTWKMSASITEDHVIEEISSVQNGKGTIVQSEGLFENYPARRLFLKRPASENLMCRETFVEKSLPRPDISFRLTIDNQLRLDLPSGVSLSERFVSALELKENPSFFSELKAETPDYSFSLVIGDPSVYRTDRKNIYIFVNGRRVSEYSMMQAIEYGCQGFFPNGTHPVAALFVQMNPALVDFNIHPAKKEVRFKDSSGLHHSVSSTVKDFFRAYGIKNAQEYEDKDNEEQNNIPSFDFDFSHPSAPASVIKEDFSRKPTQNGSVNPSTSYVSQRYSSSGSGNNAGSDLRSKFFAYESSPSKKSVMPEMVFNPDKKESEDLSSLVSEAIQDQTSSDRENIITAPESSASVNTGFCFIGVTLDCFLIAQKNETIYFIDQHAAHERILFNKILASGGEKQSLLIPYEIKTETKDEEDYLEKALPLLNSAGFEGKACGEGLFQFYSVPVRWKGNQEDLREALLDKMVKPEEIIYSVAAMTACKAAVKDGCILDRNAAEALAREALTLSDPHCPHGRPVWTTLTKEQLFARVRRTR